MTVTRVLWGGDSKTLGLESSSGAGWLPGVYSGVSTPSHSAQYQGSQLSGGVYCHEGYSGLTSAGLRQKATTFLASYAPLHVVGIDIGLNDAIIGIATEVTLANIAATLDAIYAADPTTKVILSYLTPVASPVERRAIDAINDGLLKLRSGRSWVYSADAMHPSIGFTVADLSTDGYHPNPVGYGKMAAALVAALKPLML